MTVQEYVSTIGLSRSTFYRALKIFDKDKSLLLVKYTSNTTKKYEYIDVKAVYDIFEDLLLVLSKLIFSKVHHIHRDILGLEILKWHQLLNNFNLLVYHNYLNEIKQYHNYIIIKVKFYQSVMSYISRGNSLDVLKYFIEKQPELLTLKQRRCGDLLYISVNHNSNQIFHYLESLINNNNDNSSINSNKRKTSEISVGSSRLETTATVEWDYYHAISATPLSGNMELFMYLFNKIDIRNALLNKQNLKAHKDIIETIESSAKNGRTEMLDCIFGLFKSDIHLVHEILNKNIHSLFHRTISNGHLDIIRKYFNYNYNEIKNVPLISICSQYNQFEMMKYFHEYKLGNLQSTLEYSIKNGNLKGGNLLNAIKRGNLEMVKWLHENTTENWTTYEIVCATKRGYLEIIKWLHENRNISCTTYAMDTAAKNGHLEVVKWLHENRTEGCTTDAMDDAAMNGYLEVVKWLHENRTEGCSNEAINLAAYKGHLEIVKWLFENRTEGCTTDAMDDAASNGYLEVVKWLHENRTEGCTTNAMDIAAEKGHLETIKWLHCNRTEGCTTYAMNYAPNNGDLEIIKWLHCNRTEGCTTQAMDNAASGGYFEIVKWLHENRTEGCTTGAMGYAASEGYFEIIKWLHHNRTEGCTTWAMDNSAKHGYLEIIRWLHENRTECSLTNCMDIASNIGYIEVVKWIQEVQSQVKNNGYPKKIKS